MEERDQQRLEAYEETSPCISDLPKWQIGVIKKLRELEDRIDTLEVIGYE